MQDSWTLTANRLLLVANRFAAFTSAVSLLNRLTTPFCITGCSIVDNQLNDTFGNRHWALPIGGVHK